MTDRVALNLYQTFGLRLDAAQILPLHGPRVAAMSKLAKAAGRDEPQ